jgi:D-glycero-alpha-D-manno-heptose-7-phosphate kinase
MIVTRTPFRVSLFGGGTDYPQWYQQHGGATVGMAIDKYCYISVRYLPPFFEHKHRIVYSHIENVKTVDEVRHPAVRAILKVLKVEKGLEIHHDGDLPARSGLGSSSSFTVGLLNALHALEGRMVSKDQLAKDAIWIEQEVIAENVGSQDQIWAAYGGLNHIEFFTDGTFSVQPLIISRERQHALVGSLLLYFTGLSRIASDVAKKQIANMALREKNLHTMYQMVGEAEAILTDPKRDLKQVGLLLHEGWKLKRDLASGVSTSEVDAIYDAGREAGAVGGKLIGAGGGGFVLFYVEPQHQAAVRERLKNLIEVRFDVDRAGSTVVVYSPNGLGQV